jgi:hypothetical protein
MCLELVRLNNDSQTSGEMGDSTFSLASICEGLEDRSISVHFSKAVNSTALTPVLLLHLREMSNLALQMITKGPPLVVQAHRVSRAIKGLNAGKDLGFEIAVFVT